MAIQYQRPSNGQLDGMLSCYPMDGMLAVTGVLSNRRHACFEGRAIQSTACLL